jgi:alkylation response protein AidB-like acyl-CoA dehydrogenase
MFPFGAVRHILDELVKYTKKTKRDGKPLSKDPIIRQKLAELAIEVEAAYTLYYQLAYMLDNEKIPNYQSSMQKVFSSEAAFRAFDAATEVMGPRGQLQGNSKWAPIDGEAELHYRWAIIEDIYGGTSEIQRNIIALRGLGLPMH